MSYLLRLPGSNVAKMTIGNLPNVDKHQFLYKMEMNISTFQLNY